MFQLMIVRRCVSLTLAVISMLPVKPSVCVLAQDFGVQELRLQPQGQPKSFWVLRNEEQKLSLCRYIQTPIGFSASESAKTIIKLGMSERPCLKIVSAAPSPNGKLLAVVYNYKVNNKDIGHAFVIASTESGKIEYFQLFPKELHRTDNTYWQNNKLVVLQDLVFEQNGYSAESIKLIFFNGPNWSRDRIYGKSVKLRDVAPILSTNVATRHKWLTIFESYKEYRAIEFLHSIRVGFDDNYFYGSDGIVNQDGLTAAAIVRKRTDGNVVLVYASVAGKSKPIELSTTILAENKVGKRIKRIDICQGIVATEYTTDTNQDGTDIYSVSNPGSKLSIPDGIFLGDLKSMRMIPDISVLAERNKKPNVISP